MTLSLPKGIEGCEAERAKIGQEIFLSPPSAQNATARAPREPQTSPSGLYSDDVLKAKSWRKEYVSPNLVSTYRADCGLHREIGDARAHDDVLDDRAWHPRIDRGRRR